MLTSAIESSSSSSASGGYPVADAAHRTRRVAVAKGVELQVLEAGEGDPVVLLHGWPQDGRMWRHLVPELAPTHRVLVPDLRGFGRSDAPRGDYRKHVFVDDLLALLDAEGIERAAIGGHDWGAWATWLTALEHPDRVSRLVAIDVPPPWRARPTPGRLYGQLRFGWYQLLLASPFFGQRAVRSGWAVEKILKGGSASAFRWSEADFAAYAEPFRDPAHARASVRVYRTFLTRELPRMAAGRYTADELKVPALTIMGGASPMLRMGVPEAGPLLRVEVVEGAGHFVPEEKPDEVARLVREFLA